MIDKSWLVDDWLRLCHSITGIHVTTSPTGWDTGVEILGSSIDFYKIYDVFCYLIIFDLFSVFQSFPAGKKLTVIYVY